MSAHSESGKLISLFIKKASAAFIDDAHVSKHWEALNYLGKPDIAKALEEYEAFEKILKDNGAELLYLPQDDTVNMDSIYCRDAAIATSKGMIICNMGKEGRVKEPVAEQRAFEANGIPVLGVITAPGTVEGGDVAWLDEKTLAVGHTYRTNVFRNELIARGYELVEVPDAEFDSMGCNVLALAPRVCLMVKGNPITKERLVKAGCKVIEYQGAEISVKGGGGPTCLTRPVMRA